MGIRDSDYSFTMAKLDDGTKKGGKVSGSVEVVADKLSLIHIFADDRLAECTDVRFVRLVATSSVNNNEFAGGEEFDLYAEKWVCLLYTSRCV